MSDVVDRFVASLPPWEDESSRSTHHDVEEGDDGEGRVASPSGDGWRAAAGEVGVPCPAELAALGDAHAHRHIWIGRWELLPPHAARRRWLIDQFVAEAPCLEPLRHMLPVFTADGDLLLIDREGAVRRWSVAYGAPFEDHGIVAPSLADLLDAVTRNEWRPFLESPDDAGGTAVRAGGRAHGEAWIDGIEYVWRTGHHHEQRDGAWTCITTLTGDLAPHYFRYPDGPGTSPLTGHVQRARAPFVVELVGDPAQVPRKVPVGVIRVAGQDVDLMAEAPRLTRRALALGWTGRDGRQLVLDGWQELALPRPPARHR